MPRITLLGSSLARVGSEFSFWRPCEVADRCPVSKPCQNLDVGRRYRVTAVRPAHHDTCTEHEGGVQAVEVEEIPQWGSLDAARLRGTLTKWSPPPCTVRGCPNWNLCFDAGLKTETEYRVLETRERLVCPMGHHLVRVRVEENRRPGPRP